MIVSDIFSLLSFHKSDAARESYASKDYFDGKGILEFHHDFLR